MIDLSLIHKAKTRIDPYVNTTPILTSSRLNEITNTDLFFKCENFQKSGSFKIRGALNKILQLTKYQKKKGIIAFSSGNHGQAVSYAAKLLNINSTVVMPEDAPRIKIENTKNTKENENK